MAARRIRIRPPQPVQISQIDTSSLTPATFQQQLNQAGGSGDFIRGAMQSSMVNGVSLDKARADRMAKFDAALSAINSRVLSPYESPINARRADLTAKSSNFADQLSKIDLQAKTYLQQMASASSQSARWFGQDEQKSRDYQKQADAFYSQYASAQRAMQLLQQQRDSVLGSINADIASLTQSNTKFSADAKASGKTVATAAELTSLKDALAKEQLLLNQLDATAIETIKQEVSRYNQDQQAGTVAASRSGAKSRVPLTGRFGIPDVGVGISIPTFA